MALEPAWTFKSNLPLCIVLDGSISGRCISWYPIKSHEDMKRVDNAGPTLAQVHLPGDLTALHWLRGQPLAQQPRIFFSPRQSSAPSSPGSETAGAASAGLGAVAGVGAAWLWRVRA